MRQRPPPRRDMTIVSRPLLLGSQALARNWPLTPTVPFPEMLSFLSTAARTSVSPVRGGKARVLGSDASYLCLCDGQASGQVSLLPEPTLLYRRSVSSKKAAQNQNPDEA